MGAEQEQVERIYKEKKARVMKYMKKRMEEMRNLVPLYPPRKHFDPMKLIFVVLLALYIALQAYRLYQRWDQVVESAISYSVPVIKGYEKAKHVALIAYDYAIHYEKWVPAWFLGS